MIWGLDQIGFARPGFLLALLALPALAGIVLILLARRQWALRTFAGRGAHLVTVSLARQLLKLALLLLGGAALILALAGPQVGVTERVVQREGLDVVIAMDVSQSMAVRDVAPDRLRAAGEIVVSLANELAGSRVGLVFFAGDGLVRYPLTYDLKILGQVLDASGRGFRPRPGSSLRAGLVWAVEAFPREVVESSRPKAIVLISDGEDPQVNLPPFDGLRARNFRVYTIGVGTRAGGNVPTYDNEGNFLGLLRDTAGGTVVSRLDDTTLRRIADLGGGRYWEYTGVEPVAAELGGELRAQYTIESETEVERRPDERFQIFLAIALAALLAEWFVAERRRMPLPRPIR